MQDQKNPLIEIFISWVPIAFVTTVLSFVFYLAVQQDMRQSANDPQIQIARDSVISLVAGNPVLSVLPEQKINISLSLDSFEMVFDQNEQLIASSAILNGKPPIFPTGVLTNAKSAGEENVTWQPDQNDRFAVVVIPFSGTEQSGFVVVGRSLTEVEERESALGTEVFAGWAFSMLGSLVLIFYFKRSTVLIETKKKKRKSKK